VVIRWFLSLVRTETIEKKPYNPVIGEYHHAWTINDCTTYLIPFSLVFFSDDENVM